MHHYDLYRLRGPEDMRNLDLAESFARGLFLLRSDADATRDELTSPPDAARALCAAVTLIEWAERLEELTPRRRLDVRIDDSDAAAIAAPAGEGGGADADDGDGDEAEGDARPRAVTLTAHGPRGAAAAAAVAAFVRAPPPEVPLGGLALL